ncbi:hypothetical protein CH337_03815 [Rhodoblastus acidophilus]|nr:hypothetical protein CKO16_14540 [Rhodoblastus acidophilus]RAI23159.1 hypothetical protein CH337_03815 [Rhodoblastus acidophilus]
MAIQKSEAAMVQKLELRLVGAGGEIRHRESVEFASNLAIWRALASLARKRGQPGEFLQVLDQNHEMIIRVGVATAETCYAA